MCISTNYSRKGTQPGGPEIVCALLYWILKERANLEEIGSNFIQRQPKRHSVPPRSSCAVVAAAAALAFLCVQEGLEVRGTGEAVSPEEAALKSPE